MAIDFTHFIRQSHMPEGSFSFFDCLFIAQTIVIDFVTFCMVVDKIAVEYQISAIPGSFPLRISDLLMA